MNFKYNNSNMLDYPIITYCSQNRKGKGILNVSNLTMSLMFCETSEMSFDIYSNKPHFEDIQKDTVLKVEGFGYWVVNEVDDSENGQYGVKSIKAYSYEVVLSKKYITLAEDVYRLYNALSPDDTLLGLIQNNTNWTIGHVDSTLLNQGRTMEFENVSIYDALMSNISDAFKCYFVFNTDTMTINCYDRLATPSKTCINLSFKNLIKEMTIKDNQDGIITALTVKGGDDVGIKLVNPLGTDVIYDFSHYYDDMSQSLKNKIVSWETKVENATQSYAQNVDTRQKTYAQIVTEQGVLSQKQTTLKGYMDAQSVAILGGNDTRLQELKPLIANAQTEVNTQTAKIKTLQTTYDNAVKQASTISSSLSFKNNFTENELYELEYYIKSGSYTNENFIFTEVTTEDEKIKREQELYDQACKEFVKLAHPLYEFDVSIINFISNPIYKKFTDDIELGKSVHLEYKDGTWVQPRMIKVNLEFDTPENNTIKLSDKLYSMDGLYTFANEFTDATKAANKVAISASKWDEPGKTGFYSKVNEYINNAFDLANKEILDAKDQVVAIGSYGIRGRKQEGENYSDEQIAIINNLIAFTDDGWSSVKTALGKIQIGDQQYYGLAAEAVMGRLVAADHLVISNNYNNNEATFIVDGNGATLTNSILTVTNNSNTNKILISPTDGFKIQKKNGESWEDVLTANSSGDLVITGSVEAATGSKIAGWTTTATRLTSPTGDYIGSDGTGKLSLMTWNNTSATFNGNIYANNLNWKYGDTDYSVFRSVDGGWMLDGQNLPSEDIFFGGQFYKENKDKTTGVVKSYAKLYMDRADIDTQIKGQETIFAESGGNFIIKSKNGGLVLRGTDDDGSEINPHGILTTKLSVTKESTYNGKATFFDEIDSQKNLIVTDVSAGGDGTIHFKSNAAFEGSVWFTKNQLIGVVMTDEHGAEQSWYTVTQEVNVGDKTLKFVHGLFVGAW